VLFSAGWLLKSFSEQIIVMQIIVFNVNDMPFSWEDKWRQFCNRLGYPINIYRGLPAVSGQSERECVYVKRIVDSIQK
jgi:hypothetical protein